MRSAIRIPTNTHNNPPATLTKNVPQGAHPFAILEQPAASQLNVENVVNAPKKPTVMPTRHSAGIVKWVSRTAPQRRGKNSQRG
jgi:hypothetical protein